jgi:hypothetical protein
MREKWLFTNGDISHRISQMKSQPISQYDALHQLEPVAPFALQFRGLH